MALRAGYYGIKRGLKAKLAEIAGAWDATVASIFPRKEQAEVGVKNLLAFDLSDLKKLNVSGTWAGNVYTRNTATFTYDSTDNTITINGTASGGNSVLILKSSWFTTVISTVADEYATGGGYIISDGENGRIGTSDLYLRNDGSYIYIQLSSGKTAENVKFYPMVRFSDDTDPVYLPGAMSNRDLTLSAQDQKTTINAIISAATGAADFTAFKTAMGAITPVTRSIPSGSDQRSLQAVTPEAEPEEKEAEEASEPVTKKRTTKKTVKEGE